MKEAAVAAPVAAISPSALRRSMEWTSYSVGGGKGATVGGVVTEARFQETASAPGVAGRVYGGYKLDPPPRGVCVVTWKAWHTDTSRTPAPCQSPDFAETLVMHWLW
ncbi:hypothetical protein GCM10010191_21740 [Actinomadura vinacea]|uniref:Uncharacterized protein n=1 Tax=Actinomadura vinacea TaxID=115336 RepID=A0ABN3ISS7_9ACTN